MKEYLDPTDWSLKLVNVDNDAAQPDWIEVPAGDAILALAHDGLLSLWINGQQYACRDGRLRKSDYHDNFKYWCKKWSAKIIWRRQKPRIRVYATLSQSKFEQAIAMAEAAADWSAPGWREAARKQVLENWPTEWQPDWTLAPEGYDWYAVDSDGEGTFTNYEPFMFCGRWAPPYSSHRTGIKKLSLPGVNFNYQGDWRDSLRKRPTTEWQPDWTQAPKGCDWFAVDFDGTGTFMNYEPEMFCGTWVAPSSTTHPIIKARPGTNFGYKGDWRDSLRKCKKIGGVIIL